MGKTDNGLCMIGFETEADRMVGFRELFEAMSSSGEKVTEVGDRKYIIRKELCSILKAPHQVLQE